jgi:hypothetical protein
MSNVKLKDAITVNKTIKHEVRPALIAMKCDNCGKIFGMPRTKNGHGKPGRVSGMFSEWHKNHGNIFMADACSFACVNDLFNGNWRKMDRYKGFGRRKRVYLLTVEAEMAPIIEQDELIAEWEKFKQNEKIVSS